MKRIALIGLFSGAVLAQSASQAAEGQWYLAPGAQWIDFDSAYTGLDEGSGFFAGLGFQFNERWAAEFNWSDVDADLVTGGEVDLDHYKVDLLYDFSDWRSGLRPFVVAGMGNTNFNGDNDTVLSFGAGLKWDLSDRWQLRSAVRNFSYFGRDFESSEIGVETALVYSFGDRARASRRPTPAAPAPQARQESAPATPQASDSDRDGVQDANDQCPDTPMNYAVDANGCPIAVEEVARVELMVNFDFDRDEVKTEYFDEIEEVANFMRQYDDVVIELEGHTDSRGTDAYNEDLSQRRANAVRQVLIDRFAIQGSRITARGFGERQPIASNDTDAGRAQNRRVITVIIKTLQNYRPR
jgi:OOP family OmpA-OmpF porin